MALLGKAAMILGFDVDPEAIGEHDDWHTHEHLPERLSIPGFARASRWVAQTGAPRYFVMYEVAELGVLESAAYLERLNNPSPWTTRMMAHYRGMQRGFCRLSASAGLGLGRSALLIRFKPAPGRDADLRGWLARDVIPSLASRRGLVSVHLFEAALTPPMTSEQSIRGRDSAVDWVLLATGYNSGSVASLRDDYLGEEQFERQGAGPGYTAAVYRMEVTLTDRDAVGQ